MKIKQAFKLALGAFSVAAMVGQLSAAFVTSDNGATFTDLDENHSVVSNPSNPVAGTGVPGNPFTFDVSILGPEACIVIDPFEPGDTAGTLIYDASIRVALTVINNTGFGWNSTHIRLFTDGVCDEVSPETDQWSFSQNSNTFGDGGGNVVAPPFVPTHVSDFITGPALAQGASVLAEFTLSNGNFIETLPTPLSMRIIPEPSAVVLLGLGVLGFFFRRRRA